MTSGVGVKSGVGVGSVGDSVVVGSGSKHKSYLISRAEYLSQHSDATHWEVLRTVAIIVDGPSHIRRYVSIHSKSVELTVDTADMYLKTEAFKIAKAGDVTVQRSCIESRDDIRLFKCVAWGTTEQVRVDWGWAKIFPGYLQ